MQATRDTVSNAEGREKKSPQASSATVFETRATGVTGAHATTALLRPSVDDVTPCLVSSSGQPSLRSVITSTLMTSSIFLTSFSFLGLGCLACSRTFVTESDRSSFP